LLSIYYAVIGLAIASLTDRRIVAGASIIGLFLVTSISSAIFVGDFEVNGGSPAALINVLRLPLYLRDLLFFRHIERGSPLSGVQHGGALVVLEYVVILLLGLAVLLRRYRWVER
jgi:hypothetical protein